MNISLPTRGGSIHDTGTDACAYTGPGLDRMDRLAAVRPRGAADAQATGKRMKPLPAGRIEGTSR